VSEKESGIADDVLPVSDDDVDVALEQQEDVVSISGLQHTAESKDSLENGQIGDQDDSRIASFRLGYMGHVIIISQALVHACSEENGNDVPTEENADGLPEEMVGEHERFESQSDMDGSQESPNQNQGSSSDNPASADDDAIADSLILARLVKNHPLGKIWRDFVMTKLASESALQSTPLGGLQASHLGTDQLHMHRPGLEDDGGYDDDDGDAPPLPQRGILVDGDVIDMDDNDLEVAANMMAGMNIGRGDSGDSRIQSSSHQSAYVFDDPLGGGRFGDFGDDDDGDSSSDEEPVMLDDARNSGPSTIDEDFSEHEAPVMDLFAGNFDAFDETGSGNQQSENWSDFANFDDAFGETEAPDDGHEKEEKNDFDNIFGDVKSHDILLNEPDQPSSSENGETPVEDSADIDCLSADIHTETFSDEVGEA